jgi:NAD(P)H-dependent FMN reductase
MLDLKIIIGSTRPGRAADRVIPWITSTAREHGGFGVDVIDLRDWELPMFGETFAIVGNIRNPTFSASIVRQWKIAEGDRRRRAAQGSPHQRRGEDPSR